MRILHTADWHMNDILGGRIERRDDIVTALKRIAVYLDQEKVDVMLVAGDVIERGPLSAMKDALHDIHDVFLPFLERGGTIVAISGNHDSVPFFEATRDMLDLGGSGRTGLRARKAGLHATDPIGRLYMVPRADVLRLADAHDTIVQFMLMPYPTSLYLEGQSVEYRNIEEKHRLIQRRFTETLHELEVRLDPGLPSVLVSHIYVRGALKHERYLPTEAEDIVFEQSDVPSHLAYIAYGHMHKPQAALPNSTSVRYAGSIECLDAGDINDEKSVTLIDIGPHGLEGKPRILPLETTPIIRVEIRDPDAEIVQLSERFPDAARALVAYTLHWQPGKHHRDELCRQIQAVFPRWYARTFIEIGAEEAPSEVFSAQHVHDVPGTVRTYLQAQLRGHPDCKEVLALADALLAEEVGR